MIMSKKWLQVVVLSIMISSVGSNGPVGATICVDFKKDECTNKYPTLCKLSDIGESCTNKPVIIKNCNELKTSDECTKSSEGKKFKCTWIENPIKKGAAGNCKKPSSGFSPYS
jgi:hypothetical protein